MADWNNILIAVDEMESSIRAVRYVGQIAREHQDHHTLSPARLPRAAARFRVKRRSAGRIPGSAHRQSRTYLRQMPGNPERRPTSNRDTIYCTAHMAEGKTISETVLEVRRTGNFGTVVTGKRGLSKAEEFIFGSISNALARHCSDFTTWIVG